MSASPEVSQPTEKSGYLLGVKEIKPLASVVDALLFDHRKYHESLPFSVLAQEALHDSIAWGAYTWVRTARAGLVVGQLSEPFIGTEGYAYGIWSPEQIVEYEASQGKRLLEQIGKTFRYDGITRWHVEQTLWGENSFIVGLRFLNDFIGAELARLRALQGQQTNPKIVRINESFRADTYKELEKAGVTQKSFAIRYVPSTCVQMSYPKPPDARAIKDNPHPSRTEQYYLAFQHACAYATTPLVRTILHHTYSVN